MAQEEPETQPRSPARPTRPSCPRQRPSSVRGIPGHRIVRAEGVSTRLARELFDLVRDLRDEDGYVMCIDVTAVDYAAHPGRVELPPEVEPERFEVVVLLLSLATGDRLRLRVQVPEDDLGRAVAVRRPSRAPRPWSARCSTCSASASTAIPT